MTLGPDFFTLDCVQIANIAAGGTSSLAVCPWACELFEVLSMPSVILDSDVVLTVKKNTAAFSPSVTVTLPDTGAADTGVKSNTKGGSAEFAARDTISFTSDSAQTAASILSLQAVMRRIS